MKTYNMTDILSLYKAFFRKHWKLGSVYIQWPGLKDHPQRFLYGLKHNRLSAHGFQRNPHRPFLILTSSICSFKQFQKVKNDPEFIVYYFIRQTSFNFILYNFVLKKCYYLCKVKPKYHSQFKFRLQLLYLHERCKTFNSDYLFEYSLLHRLTICIT